MARILNEQDYKARRSQILEVTRRLIYTIGYEQMSIQDILDELKMSKGAFYHYFDSKPALLEALIDHMVEEAEVLSLPIFADHSLSPLARLRRWYDTSAAWKSAQKEYLLAFVKIWYADENAILRQKMFSKEIKFLKPVLGELLREGSLIGEFNTPYPDESAEAIFYLFQGLGDKFSDYLIEYENQASPDLRCQLLDEMDTSMLAYSEAIERVLGAPRGSLRIMDQAVIRAWFEN